MGEVPGFSVASHPVALVYVDVCDPSSRCETYSSYVARDEKGDYEIGWVSRGDQRLWRGSERVALAKGPEHATFVALDELLADYCLYPTSGAPKFTPDGKRLLRAGRSAQGWRRP